MKKNRMMRLASLLLVLVLMTSSVVGGTFAKYTTGNNAFAEARVAYWGFETPATIQFDLFAHNDSGVLKNGLLAPGTTKTIDFEFINSKLGDRAPEVDYQVTVTTEGSVAPSPALDAQIVWYYNDQPYEVWTDFTAAIAAETQRYEAGTLPEFLQEAVTNSVGWAWAFEDNSDVEDTLLGNAAAAEGDIQVKLAINVLVEQVNE